VLDADAMYRILMPPIVVGGNMLTSIIVGVEGKDRGSLQNSDGRGAF
jgi:hypothetical protein